MKKYTLLFGAFLALFLISCEGPIGPAGFDGLDGPQGEAGIQGQVLEIDGVNFEYDGASNLHVSRLTFADFTKFEVFESDAILVYRFDGVVDLTNGTANNWSLIPQNFFTAEGTIQYTNAHNFIDVDLFIDGNYDLANLSSDFTQNQFFRIVIVPSVFLNSSKMDKANIAAVMNSLGIEEKDVQKIKLN